MLTTENLINPAAFRIYDGNVHLHESVSPSMPSSQSPVNIIKEDQVSYAHFVWKQDGWLLPLISTGCKYECRVYIEQMGPLEVGNPAPATVAFTPGSGNSFSAIVTIAGLTEGAYKLVATVMFRSPSGSLTPLAAYEELGILQVYKG
jgi:hypothetical protein